MQQILQILGMPTYWEDRADVLQRLATILPDPPQRRQLLMFAEQDRAIAEAMKAYEERQRAD